jgi:hypothetical protein
MPNLQDLIPELFGSSSQGVPTWLQMGQEAPAQSPAAVPVAPAAPKKKVFRVRSTSPAATPAPGTTTPAGQSVPAGYQQIQLPDGRAAFVIPQKGDKTGQTSSTDVSRAIPMTPEDTRALGDDRDVLVNDYLKSFRDQEAGVQEQLQRLQDVEKYTAPVGPDLRAFANAANFLSRKPANLTAGYEAPMAPAERASMLLKLDNSIQSQRSKLTGMDIAILGKLLPGANRATDKSGTTTETTTGAPKIVVPPSPKNPPASQQADTKGFVRDFDKATAGQKKAKEAADMVLTAFASGSKVAPAAAQSLITIASGESARHAAQIENKFQGDPALSATIKRAFQRASEGTLTEHDQNELSALAKAYAASHADTLADLYNDFTGTRYEAYHIPRDQAARLLEPYKPQPKAPQLSPLQQIMQQFGGSK